MKRKYEGSTSDGEPFESDEHSLGSDGQPLKDEEQSVKSEESLDDEKQPLEVIFLGVASMSDLTVLTTTTIWKVQKGFLAAHSKFFERVFNDPLAGHQITEFDLTHHDLKVVEVMLRRMHDTGDGPRNLVLAVEDLTYALPLTAIKLCYVAEEYQAAELQDVALEAFVDQIKESTHDDFAACAKAVEAEDGSHLIDGAIKAILHKECIKRSYKTLDEPVFATMLSEVPSYGAVVANHYYRANLGTQAKCKAKKCASRGNIWRFWTTKPAWSNEQHCIWCGTTSLKVSRCGVDLRLSEDVEGRKACIQCSAQFSYQKVEDWAGPDKLCCIDCGNANLKDVE